MASTRRPHAPRTSRTTLLRQLGARLAPQVDPAIEHVRAHPGATASDVAKTLGMRTATAIRLLSWLDAHGRIKRRPGGRDGYEVAPERGPAPAEDGPVVIDRSDPRGLVIVRRTVAPPFSAVLFAETATPERIAREVARLTAMGAP